MAGNFEYGNPVGAGTTAPPINPADITDDDELLIDDGGPTPKRVTWGALKTALGSLGFDAGQADAWLASKTSDDLTEGAARLYLTAGQKAALLAALIKVATIEDNATADQNAGEVPITAITGVTGTDVQGALESLKTLIDNQPEKEIAEDFLISTTAPTANDEIIDLSAPPANTDILPVSNDTAFSVQVRHAGVILFTSEPDTTTFLDVDGTGYQKPQLGDEAQKRDFVDINEAVNFAIVDGEYYFIKSERAWYAARQAGTFSTDQQNRLASVAEPTLILERTPQTLAPRQQDLGEVIGSYGATGAPPAIADGLRVAIAADQVNEPWASEFPQGGIATADSSEPNGWLYTPATIDETVSDLASNKVLRWTERAGGSWVRIRNTFITDIRSIAELPTLTGVLDYSTQIAPYLDTQGGSPTTRKNLLILDQDDTTQNGSYRFDSTTNTLSRQDVIAPNLYGATIFRMRLGDTYENTEWLLARNTSGSSFRVGTHTIVGLPYDPAVGAVQSPLHRDSTGLISFEFDESMTPLPADEVVTDLAALAASNPADGYRALINAPDADAGQIATFIDTLGTYELKTPPNRAKVLVSGDDYELVSGVWSKGYLRVPSLSEYPDSNIVTEFNYIPGALLDAKGDPLPAGRIILNPILDVWEERYQFSTPPPVVGPYNWQKNSNNLGAWFRSAALDYTADVNGDIDRFTRNSVISAQIREIIEGGTAGEGGPFNDHAYNRAIVMSSGNVRVRLGTGLGISFAHYIELDLSLAFNSQVSGSQNATIVSRIDNGDGTQSILLQSTIAQIFDTGMIQIMNGGVGDFVEVGKFQTIVGSQLYDYVDTAGGGIIP